MIPMSYERPALLNCRTSDRTEDGVMESCGEQEPEIPLKKCTLLRQASI